VWELPASGPPDPNSGGPGLKGDRQGTLEPCVAFTITEIAWSIYNQEYYVYAETLDVKGWIALQYIEVIP
jgi:hypothetical protein